MMRIVLQNVHLIDSIGAILSGHATPNHTDLWRYMNALLLFTAIAWGVAKLSISSSIG